MTFIASVIAKKGVAIVADSLVTTKRPVLELGDFEKYLSEKSKESDNAEFKIDPTEIGGLFKKTTSHTKDFEDKLFEYDKYTAITTAGSAQINGMKIESLVTKIIKINHRNRASYSRKKIATKVKDFCKHLEDEVKLHLDKYGFIGSTTFIITHYEKNKEETKIYRVQVLGIRKENIKDDTVLVESNISVGQKVVCDGQTRITERILYGELLHLLDFVPKLIAKVAVDCPEIKDKINTQDYIMKLLGDKGLINQVIIDDMKIYKLTDLSLQQATDLANLLMRIEMDFQKFTENIPVVGGVIKLAVIDKDGFKFISGNEIIIHNNY